MKKIICISDHYVTKLGLFLMIVAAVGLLVVQSAQAESTTGNISISATVPISCTINTTSVNFGNYTGITLHNTITVLFECNVSGTYQAYIIGNRYMDTDPPNVHLNYQLYSDSGFSVVFPSGAPYTDPAAYTAGANSLSVYAELLGSQNVPAGNYSGTVVLTIIY